MIVAWPLGVGAAIYLSEYAKPRVRRVLKPILEILAGIPSVVLGFFALTVISPDLVQGLFTDAPQFNLLAAGLGVGILTIPLDRLHLRGRPALGAQRPAGGLRGPGRPQDDHHASRSSSPPPCPASMAALIVGVSRAIGETMVVAIAAGASGGSLFTTDPARTGPDDDRGHGLPGDRHRPGPRRQRGLPEPLLRRPGPLRDHPDPQHRVRALRRAGSVSGTRSR